MVPKIIPNLSSFDIPGNSSPVLEVGIVVGTIQNNARHRIYKDPAEPVAFKEHRVEGVHNALRQLDVSATQLFAFCEVLYAGIESKYTPRSSYHLTYAEFILPYDNCAINYVRRKKLC